MYAKERLLYKFYTEIDKFLSLCKRVVVQGNKEDITSK